ncbi:MAG: hypothetical protein P8M25_00120 [Paracoccaceae bacterium]|nr:hypothetical protein [Paracoccaceae bacterium]
MTDLYTKVVLTIIALALSINVLVNLEFVGPALAASGVQKVQICDFMDECAIVYNGALKVNVHEHGY